MREPPILRPNRPAPQQPQLQPLEPQRSQWSQLLESRGVMFGMLFCVTGFLGIPFLWMSSKFSRNEKIVWSIIVTIYTLILIGIAVVICWWSYTQITQSLR